MWELPFVEDGFCPVFFSWIILIHCVKNECDAKKKRRKRPELSNELKNGKKVICIYISIYIHAVHGICIFKVLLIP